MLPSAGAEGWKWKSPSACIHLHRKNITKHLLLDENMPHDLFAFFTHSSSGTTRCVQEYDEQKRRQLIESGGYTVQQMEPWLRLMHDASDRGVE